MAYYEYTCQECFVATAAIHGMNEEFKNPCAYCGKVNWQQRIFPPSLSFKGSGFYSTDYKKG